MKNKSIIDYKNIGMKLFTSDCGKFQMFIPIDWEYKNPYHYKNIDAPYSFERYEKPIGTFQVSCKPINNHIAQIILNNGLTVHSLENSKIVFMKRIIDQNKYKQYTWMAAVYDHFIFITYIIDINKCNSGKVKKELFEINNSIESFKFIRQENREIVLVNRRFEVFMSSLAAAYDLRNKALQSVSNIEYIVLTANCIDALLRLAIILTNQIENRNDEIDSSLLFQNILDKPKMEKDIYKIVLKRGIVDQKMHDELFDLYNERNKVIHRYIITDIKTEEILNIAVKYHELCDQINEMLGKLELKQFDLKIGIYGHGESPVLPYSGSRMKELQFYIKDKHGRIRWPGNIDRLKPK